MIFTTQIFLFVFFPLNIFAYFVFSRLERSKYFGKVLARIRTTDVVLIIFGCVFYAWACFDNVIKLLLYVLIIYLLGLWISFSIRKGRYILIESKNTQNAEKKIFRLCIIPFLLPQSPFYFV